MCFNSIQGCTNGVVNGFAKGGVKGGTNWHAKGGPRGSKGCSALTQMFIEMLEVPGEQGQKRVQIGLGLIIKKNCPLLER